MQMAIYENTLRSAYDRLDAARFDPAQLGAPVVRELIPYALFHIENAEQFADEGNFSMADRCITHAVSILREIPNPKA